MHKYTFVTVFLISASVFIVYKLYDLMLFNSKFKFMNETIGHILSVVYNDQTNNGSQVQDRPLQDTGSRSDFITAAAVDVNISVNYTTLRETPHLYITISLIKRLGNQMFSYASLLGLASAHNRKPFISNGRDLVRTFRISQVNKQVSSDGWKVMHESGYATFDSRLMKLPEENLIITGYLQSWRYFHHAQDVIRREFTLSPTLQKYAHDILTRYRRLLDNNVLVGVHVRRGDFLAPYFVRLGYGVPNSSYFTNAFNKMRSLLPNQNVTFVVASDDLDWCQHNLNDTSVRILPRRKAAEHFAILSSCDHVIITGGTYGWWSAWLANGITIYYSNYVAENMSIHYGFNVGDYYPPGWIGMDN